MENQEVVKSAILLDTRYDNEECDLTWNVANFSQIFGVIQADFSLKQSSTVWKIKLIDKESVYLFKCDTGEPIKVDINYHLKTKLKTFQGEIFHKFDDSNTNVLLLNFSTYQYQRNIKTSDETLFKRKHTVKFDNDVFKFRCTMEVVGPAKTKIIRSTDFMKPNLEKLCDDFKKLLHNREHCDVTISSGTEKLPVHKAVLCARSEVFNRMFQNDKREDKNKIVELDDLDFDTLNDFITFLYTGEVNISSLPKATNLLYAAEKYEVKDLHEICSSFIHFDQSTLFCN